MELISFTKKEMPKDVVVLLEAPINNVSQPSTIQFFGIINTGAKSVILVGPYDDENKTLVKLTAEVGKLMQNPATELIVNEDTAIVYQKIDDELFVKTRININEILDEGDED